LLRCASICCIKSDHKLLCSFLLKHFFNFFSDEGGGIEKNLHREENPNCTYGGKSEGSEE
jgi:hypothetical protein